MRYLWLIALAVLAWRLFMGRWPWSRWLGEPGGRRARSGEAERARLLLGVGKGASRDEIIAAHRQLVAAVHPDRGGTTDLVVEANSARDTLLAQTILTDQETP